MLPENSVKHFVAIYLGLRVYFSSFDQTITEILSGFTKITQHKKASNHVLTYPWKCTVLHCNHLGNTWKPLVLMTRHFDYCPSASEGDNQSVRSSAPVVSRCFPGGYNVKLYISRGRLAWWLLACLHSVTYLWHTSEATAISDKTMNNKCKNWE